MKSVYIIGSKGIPANYGGFETFVEKLTENQKNKNIKYFVACTRENSKKSNISEDFFEYNGATCFNIDVPNIGPAKAMALKGEYNGNASAEGYMLEDGTALNLSDKDQKWLGLKDTFKF